MHLTTQPTPDGFDCDSCCGNIGVLSLSSSHAFCSFIHNQYRLACQLSCSQSCPTLKQASNEESQRSPYKSCDVIVARTPDDNQALVESTFLRDAPSRFKLTFVNRYVANCSLSSEDNRSFLIISAYLLESTHAEIESPIVLFDVYTLCRKKLTKDSQPHVTEA